MTHSLNIVFILKNKYFRKILFPEKRTTIFFLICTFISVGIYSAFPLITQTYIRHIYHQTNITLLLEVTFYFSIIYIIKYLIDRYLEIKKIHLFSRIQRKIKIAILKKYKNNTNKLLKEKSSLYSKHLFLYMMLIKKTITNISDIAKISFILIIIFFFNRKIFLYSLFSIPFITLFYFLIKQKINQKYTQEKREGNADFGLLIKETYEEDPENAEKIIEKNLKIDFKKEIQNKSKFVSINEAISSFINFYRLYYLAYFGYFIITQQIFLAGLIVDLLFITLLLIPITNLMKSIPTYHICTKSFYKINSVFK